MYRGRKRVTSDPFKKQKIVYYTILIFIIFVVVASIVYSMFYVSAEGFLKADEMKLESPILGHVERLYVDVGDSVKPGDPIVTLNDLNGGSLTLRATIIRDRKNWEVVEKFCNEGEVVTHGEQIVLLEDKNYYILAFFKDSVINDLFYNFPVSVVFKNGGRYTGRIYKIYPVVYPINEKNKFYRSDTRFVPVMIKLDNFDGSKYFYNARAKVFLNKLEIFRWKRSQTR